MFKILRFFNTSVWPSICCLSTCLFDRLSISEHVCYQALTLLVTSTLLDFWYSSYDGPSCDPYTGCFITLALILYSCSFCPQSTSHLKTNIHMAANINFHLTCNIWEASLGWAFNGGVHFIKCLLQDVIWQWWRQFCVYSNWLHLWRLFSINSWSSNIWIFLWISFMFRCFMPDWLLCTVFTTVWSNLHS